MPLDLFSTNILASPFDSKRFLFCSLQSRLQFRLCRNGHCCLVVDLILLSLILFVSSQHSKALLSF